MKYAVSLPNGGECGTPRLLSDLACLAESSGWDAIFLEDYIVWQGHSDAATYDPWISLAAMASCTTKIRLGTMVTPLPRRRPWKLAREAISLDHLSGGRVILGIGLGDTTIDTSFTRFGEEADSARRARMLDEGLTVLDRLMRGRRFTFHGEFYRLDGAAFSPRPVQQPRIPIWIGGVWPLRGPTRRALRWDGACLYKLPPDDEWTAKDVRALARLARSERQTGVPFDIVVGHASWQRAKDPEKERAHIASLANAGATWWAQYIPPDEPRAMWSLVQEGPLRAE
jgi:alkanesulfonate monooxygenase SsuD/methylene tetrahydromethanopterin reductase-like flavin-dependent oxidoreductase (luciferase family)